MIAFSFGLGAAVAESGLEKLVLDREGKEASFDNDRVERFEGQILKIKHRVEGGSYRVVADVKNRQTGGEWLLRAGQIVRMTIHSDRTPLPAAVSN